jgi:ribosomal protein L7/L12
MSLGLLALIALLLLLMGGALRQLGQRLQEQERLIRLLLDHAGVDPLRTIEPSAQVRSLARDPERYIEAIRAYRMQSGAGLREARAVVDSLRAAG